MARTRYFHPLPGLTSTGRTDMGVDYSATPGSRVLAIGAGIIDAIIPNWFKGQPLVEERLTEGPYKGRYVYYAEQLTPSVRVGQRVRGGQTIGRVRARGTGLELGFGAGSGRTAAQAGGGYKEGQVTPEGQAFSRFIGSLGGPTTRPVRSSRQTYTLAELWTQAGGSRNLAPIMAAIALAESGGDTGVVGGPNSNGTYDYGLWQINSAHSQFDRQRLLTDPLYNARAAVSVYRSQGLTAWSTYSNGAYKSHLGQSSGSLPTFGRTRPGGSTDESGPEAEFASYTQDASWHWNPLSPIPIPTPFKVPGIPSLGFSNPLDVFKDSAKAVKDTADFLKWIAWIFHPRNVLRVVEFTTGLTLMGFGLHTLLAVYRDAPQSGAAPRAGRKAKDVAKTAASATPPGRAVRTASAARYGRRAARDETRAAERQRTVKRAKAKERKRQGQKGQKRDVRRARFSREKVPF